VLGLFLFLASRFASAKKPANTTEMMMTLIGHRRERTHDDVRWCARHTHSAKTRFGGKAHRRTLGHNSGGSARVGRTRSVPDGSNSLKNLLQQWVPLNSTSAHARPQKRRIPKEIERNLEIRKSASLLAIVKPVERDLKSGRFASLRKSRAEFLSAGDQGNVRRAVAGRAGAVGTEAKRVFQEPLQDCLVTSPPAQTSRHLIAHPQRSYKSATWLNRMIWSRAAHKFLSVTSMYTTIRFAEAQQI
jgi:hypothetical protein